MLKPKLFLATILIFYVSNIYATGISSVLITWKWSVLLLMLYVFFTNVSKRENQEYFTPDHIHVAFGLIIIYGLVVTYLNTSSITGIAKLLGFLLVLTLALKLSKYFMLEENHNNYYKIILLVASIVIFSSVVMFVLGLNLGRVAAGSSRFAGWADNPNTLGMMLLPLYPVLLLYSLNNKSISLTAPRVQLALLVFLVIMTGSRAAAAAIGVATIVIMSYQKGGKEKIVLLSIVSLVVVALIGVELQEFFTKMAAFQRSEKLVLSGREEVWGLAILLIQQNPYLGYGFDTEASLIKEYGHLLLSHQGKVFHNSYLSYVVHLGLLGLIPLIWLIIISLRSMLLLRFLSTTHKEMNMRLISAAIVMSSLIHAIFETWLFSPGNLATLIFWFSVFNLNCKRQISA